MRPLALFSRRLLRRSFCGSDNETGKWPGLVQRNLGAKRPCLRIAPLTASEPWSLPFAVDWLVNDICVSSASP